MLAAGARDWRNRSAKRFDGFRTESDVSRLLVLVTDGEDQDSHPLDAAEAAAERGVKILAIGFGDEAGSEIYVTNPQTGARTQIRDSAGQPVISRLDGETLRDMALATDGAYIPAGTGAMDLKSIYDAHIAPLVRGQLDDRGHAVRYEAFQWAVLAGFVLLVVSVIVGSGSIKSASHGWDLWKKWNPLGSWISQNSWNKRHRLSKTTRSQTGTVSTAEKPMSTRNDKYTEEATVGRST